MDMQEILKEVAESMLSRDTGREAFFMYNLAESNTNAKARLAEDARHKLEYDLSIGGPEEEKDLLEMLQKCLYTLCSATSPGMPKDLQTQGLQPWASYIGRTVEIAKELKGYDC
jgi:hypothetical protein